jgi:hypothetical protein
MAGRQFAARMNHVYFDGALAPSVVDRIGALPVDRDDARAFVERMFRSMRAAGFRAQDVSVLQAEILAALLSRLLPGNWEGRVPPITVAGRHSKLDLLVANVAAENGLSATFIDVACGFPPVTTVDTAAALDTWQVTGVDRSLPAYLVNDAHGNYAVFDADGRALYFQPTLPAIDTWSALLEDWEGSRRRFEQLLQDLLEERRRRGQPARIEHDGATLDVDPARAYEHDRLRFVHSDLSDATLPPAGVVRCCNMLVYFDRQFRSEALASLAALLEPNGLLVSGTDWAFTTEARYFTYRKRDGALTECQFNFSLDNVTPLGIVPWFTLHDDDVELELLTDIVGILRTDPGFARSFTERSDALRAEMNLIPRGPDGYYLTAAPDVPPSELWLMAARLGDQLGEEFGPAAVAVLARHGFDARLNSIGHVAIRVPVV